METNLQHMTMKVGARLFQQARPFPVPQHHRFQYQYTEDTESDGAVEWIRKGLACKTRVKLLGKNVMLPSAGCKLFQAVFWFHSYCHRFAEIE